MGCARITMTREMGNIASREGGGGCCNGMRPGSCFCLCVCNETLSLVGLGWRQVVEGRVEDSGIVRERIGYGRMGLGVIWINGLLLEKVEEGMGWIGIFVGLPTFTQ